MNLDHIAGLSRSLAGAPHIRREALARLTGTDLTRVDEEAWRYLSPATFLQRDWTLAQEVPGTPGEEQAADDADFVFVDGSLGEHTTIADLTRPPGTPFAAIARALGRGGMAILDLAGPRYARYSITEAGHLNATAHTLRVRAGNRGQLVERFTGRGASFTCTETEVTLEEGAELVHVRIVEEGEDVLHHGTIDVEVGPGARYHLVSLVLGGSTVRIEPTVRLVGVGARTELHGLVALRGNRTGDHHVQVDHVAPRCVSRQTFRSLLDGRSRGIFTGNVRVRPGAIGTDSGQLHRALLLSDDAVANARPQLEIEADDVKCSHGAAVGALDEEMMFYLQQRGLDRNEARRLLLGGFVKETLAAVPDERWRAHADALFEERWGP